MADIPLVLAVSCFYAVVYCINIILFVSFQQQNSLWRRWLLSVNYTMSIFMLYIYGVYLGIVKTVQEKSNETTKPTFQTDAKGRVIL